MSAAIFDIVGIGFGPSNLALAICLQESKSTKSVRFTDSNPHPGWQREMLLDGSDIQNNPLRDLVTPRNPRSHYSFINYLKETGRIFEYLNLPAHYPLRREYANYVEWAAQHFSDIVQSGVATKRLQIENAAGTPVWALENDDGSRICGRALVLGTGRTPNIPSTFRAVRGDKVFHLTQYSSKLKQLTATPTRIAVIGSSQSAVEILLDLLSRYPQSEIYSIQRGFGFRLKDTSPFSDRVYFPEFIDYYYNLSRRGKANLDSQLRTTNYSSADAASSEPRLKK